MFSEFRYRVKQWVGRHPSLYFPVFKNRAGYEDRLVGQKHDICIEGFPRSANSFAVGAFESVNPTAKVAHHAHVPAQLMRACEIGIPAIALIRDPVDTMISGHGLELQIAAVENRPVGAQVSFETRLQGWVSFYEALLPHREDIVIATFEVVTEDFGQAVDAVNRRYGTDFARFEHSDESVTSIRSSRGYHALPSDQRNQLKKRARDRFKSEVGLSHPLVQRSEQLFEQVTNRVPLYPASAS